MCCRPYFNKRRVTTKSSSYEFFCWTRGQTETVSVVLHRSAPPRTFNRERDAFPRQPNKRRHVLRLAAGLDKHRANAGNFHSHIFTHALRLYFFQVTFTGRTIFGEKKGATRHARVSVHGRKYYWRRPLLGCAFNPVPGNIFRLCAGSEGLCHYRVFR